MARFCISVEGGTERSAYLRLPCMDLHDCNELDHYRRYVVSNYVVYDYEVDKCDECCRGSGLVDCILECGDRKIGVEFKGACDGVCRALGEDKGSGCGVKIGGRVVVVVGSQYALRALEKCKVKEIAVIRLRDLCDRRDMLCDGGVFLALL